MRRSAVAMLLIAAVIGAIAVAALAKLLAMDNINFWVGVGMGALILPTFVLIYLGQIRWAAGSFLAFTVLALVAEGISAGPVAVFFGASCILAGSILALFFSADILGRFYGGDASTALANHLQLAVGRIREVQEIDNGRIVVPKDGEAIVGPTQLKIKPYNAAVVMSTYRDRRKTVKNQQDSGQSRPRYETDVFGPGDFTTRPLDRVIAVYDLREKRQPLVFNQVRTQDGKMVNVQLGVKYSLDVRDDAKDGHSNLNVDERRAIYSFAVSRIDWEAVMKSALESSVREILGATLAPALLAGQQLDWYEQRIAELAAKKLHNSGVRISQVIIENAHEQS
jgi:hypothetical protein